LKNLPATGVIAVLADAVHDWQPVALAELQVVLAVRRRNVHDAGAILGGHELRRTHAANVAGGGKIVEQPLVAHAVELAAARAAHDRNGLVLEDGADERLREDQSLVAALDPHVLDVGMHGEQQVRRQRPGRRGPHEKGSALLAVHAEPDVDRRILDLAIPLRDLVRRQRRPDARVVGHDLVALVDEAFVPDLLQQTPDAFDVVVVQREVGAFEIDPEAHALGHGFPFGDVAQHGCPALRREARDADLLLDAALVEDAELFLDFVLDRQTVRVPACLARAVESPHRLITRVQVLERPG
jgi:hypothetical protein